MVRGAAIAVTAVAGTYQWAESESTARGRGREAPSAAQARVQEFSVSAFSGLPWPTNSAGRAVLISGPLRQQLHGALIEPRAQRVTLAGARHVAHHDLRTDAARIGADGDAGLHRDVPATLAARGAAPLLLRLA